MVSKIRIDTMSPFDRAIVRAMKRAPGDWTWTECLTRAELGGMTLFECTRTRKWHACLPVGPVPLGRRAQRAVNHNRAKVRSNAA